LSLAAAVRAEDHAPHAPPKARDTVEAHAAPQHDRKSITQVESRRRKTPLHVEKPAPNETAHGHVKVDGILVQLVTTDNPLQFINPAAPERYSSAEDNFVRDSASGKISGLKFLELRF